MKIENNEQEFEFMQWATEAFRSTISTPLGKTVVAGVAMFTAATVLAAGGTGNSDPNRDDHQYPDTATAACEWYDDLNTSYEVQGGDTLRSIVDSQVGTSLGRNWTPKIKHALDEVAGVNGIDDPAIIIEGQSIILPHACLKP